MPQSSPSMVADIRAASRELVRQFGLTNQTVAGTDMSLSAVHAIIEIGLAGKLSSRQLSEQLLLEKSTISRLVKSLQQRGLVEELRSEQDLRVKLLSLTRSGKQTLRSIDLFAEARVNSALDQLSSDSRLCVLKGLQDYSKAMSNTTGIAESTQAPDAFEIKSGYTPSIIARTVELLHMHMHRNFGFGDKFEARIATDIAEFMSRIDYSCNATWHAQLGDNIVGAISIDGQDLDDGLAHLRWFVVSEGTRGGGIGHALLSQALAFCDQRGFHETHLWTVKGLDAARRLYEQQGFVLAEEYYGNQWGTRILEQRFLRQRPQ